MTDNTKEAARCPLCNRRMQLTGMVLAKNSDTLQADICDEYTCANCWRRWEKAGKGRLSLYRAMQLPNGNLLEITGLD